MTSGRFAPSNISIITRSSTVGSREISVGGDSSGTSRCTIQTKTSVCFHVGEACEQIPEL